MPFENINFTTFTAYRDKMDTFVSNYGRPFVFMPPDPPLRGRIPRSERVCRFCDQRMPEVKFRSEPHIIPQLLGRNYGVSDFECDTCNHHFSTFETHFADFLGLTRTMTSLGRKKVPKFTSPKDTLIAAQMGKGANKNFITISDESGENFHFDPARKTWEIKYSKNSYTPLRVYQSLLKIGLSVLPAEEVANYPYLKEFLLHDKYIEFFRPFAKVFQCTTEFQVERPYCILFRKNQLDIQRPMHMMYLCFDNFSYQIFLPFHKSEPQLYQAGDVELVYAPPFLFMEGMEMGKCKTELLDLTSSEKIIGENGYIRFQVDEQLFTHTYNTKTKEIKEEPFTQGTIKKIILSLHDGPLDLQELNLDEPAD